MKAITPSATAKAQLPVGVTFMEGASCVFRLWASKAQKVDLHIVAPIDATIPMHVQEDGYFTAQLDGIQPGARYFYSIDGEDFPDPASHFQPEGVAGASEVVAQTFDWQDTEWTGLPVERYVIYELHVGTYTEAGTFEAIISHLDTLKALGITAIELMPVAQFPGERNWGYDGVYTYAPQNSYGGPQGLKALVNACHQRGLAVILDVVYNHFGPEGNFNVKYADYFTDYYTSKWGSCLNFDGPYSDHVRRYFIDNALYWFRDYHLDALRLDATHAIVDQSERLFLEQLVLEVAELRQKLNREIYLIAENAKNDTRVVRPPQEGGYGLDAQWNDDFHHALRTLLTGERAGYYEDYGDFSQFVKAFREGFVFSGQYSRHLLRNFGTSSRTVPSHRFVVFSQNHDHIGNRMCGERPNHLLPFDSVKLMAAAVILSPYIPLLFMGEEYGESAPFLYFVSFSDEKLVKSVQEGRQKEFGDLVDGEGPPDPQAESTFRQSKLCHSLEQDGHHATLREFYRQLLWLRQNVPALAHLSKEHMEIIEHPALSTFMARRWYADSEGLCVFNFSDQEVAIPLPTGAWELVLDSSDARWQIEKQQATNTRALLNMQTTQLMTLSVKAKSALVLTRI